MSLEITCNIPRTPPPVAIDTMRLLVALSFAYNIISAWDAVIDYIGQVCLGIKKTTLKGLVQQALLSTFVGLLALYLVRIDVDDVFGSVLEA